MSNYSFKYHNSLIKRKITDVTLSLVRLQHTTYSTNTTVITITPRLSTTVNITLTTWEWIAERHPSRSELTGVFHGRSHHQEGHSDADGYKHLDQLSHPGVRPVTFINNLHGLVGRVMDVGGWWKWGHNKEEGGHVFVLQNIFRLA